MYTDNIIRDIKDIIYETKKASERVYESRKEADRVFRHVKEGSEGTLESYTTVADGLVEASHNLDYATEDFLNLEVMLQTLIYNVEMEALSAKVQSK